METKRGVKKIAWTTTVLFVLVGYLLWALLRPLPAIKPDDYSSSLSFADTQSSLKWPLKGQSAVSILDTDVFETHGPQKPLPTASTAKIITALMVLQKKPLGKGQTGPTYTITPADVEIYKRYVARDGSVLPVQAGMQLTEYQMLQALMLPSANNIADALAIWAYGSLPSYSKAANAYLKSQDINNTTIGSDASGLNPDTKSTAEDLVKIGALAMKHVVLSEVASQSTAAGLPNNPIIRNVNDLLGKDGIVGIKTGNSDEAGGVFVGAAKHTVNGRSLTFVTAVVGAATRQEALAESQTLIRSAEKNFNTATIAQNGQKLATYTAPWGETRKAILNEPITITRWKNEKIKSSIKLNDVKIGQKDSGIITFSKTSATESLSKNVELEKAFDSPGIGWRLLHPLN